tara:strand:+ start:5596 stop:6324 length:729 start_codon:yes stop_codon:yes gene_type:complete
MPNYTITRQVEAEDIVGCTDFQTTQTENTDATLGGGALDGDIIWYITANGGYSVDILDFSIPGATLNTMGTEYVWTGGPYLYPTSLPILGVVMEQVTPMQISVTIYLAPSGYHGITGPLFQMPSSNVSVTLPIDGCAKLGAPPSQMVIENKSGQPVVTTTTVNEKQAGLTYDEAEGTISGDVDVDLLSEPIASYTVNAPNGSRFKAQPTLLISTKDYIAKSTVTNDDNGNIISKTFNIFKAI